MFSSSHPPPPLRHHHTTQVPQSRALDLISAYLDAAKTSTDIISATPNATSPAPSSNHFSLSTPRNSIPKAAAAPKGAALHPNAVLTEAGPVVPAGGVAGLVLRNLERVRAGLKGEVWAAEPAEEGLGLDEVGMEQGFLGEGQIEVEEVVKGDDWVDGWQDKEEFEREQEQEVFVRDEDVTGKDVPNVKAEPARIEEGSRLVNSSRGDAAIDEQARKKAKKQAKKERKKKENQSRAKARENRVSPGG